jgi:hypothetical protein
MPAMTRTLICGIAAIEALFAARIYAQSDRPIELGVQVASVRSSQFDAWDTGVGGRLAWRPSRLFGIEGEINLFPREFPHGRPFTGSRVEGLFGMITGVQIGRVAPLVRVRPGFVVIGESPEPLACILIYPPPIACTLAAGRTVFALDLGGGLEVAATSRTFVRVDLGDRAVRYPGPVFDTSRVVRDKPFFSHDFRLAAGAGVRF